MLDNRNALTHGGQTLTNLDSTGVMVEDVLDVETGGADGKMDAEGWLSVSIRSASFTGGTEGMNITLVTSDSATLASGNVDLVSSGTIPVTEVVAGARFSFGFISRKNLRKHVGAWVKAHTTTFTGTIVLDVWLDSAPMTPLNLQVNNAD